MYLKISTRGRYGLKAMVDLAVNSQNGGCVSLKSIAQRQAISEPYLEQLVVNLKKNKLVKSIRGAQGGYILGREPENISVGDILRALEGDLNLVDCFSDDKSCGGNGCNKCVAKGVWAKISGSLEEAADSISLLELINDSKNI